MAINDQALVDFLRDELDVDTAEVDATTPLFSSGIIDSFALISLMTFIENQCNFRINPADVTLENMDSIERIQAFTTRMAAA